MLEKSVFGYQKIKLGISVLLVLFLSASSISFAQIYPFDRYTSKDGLLMDYVIALCCDSRGYLWIGTNDGVSIYDGDVFRNYTVADGLAYSRVNCVTESRKHPGTLWIGTNGGGVSEWKADKFRTYRMSTSHLSNIVTSLFEDNQGTLWCGTADGLFQFKGDEFKQFAPSVIHGTLNGVTQSADGKLWALMSGRALRFVLRIQTLCRG